MQFFKPASVLSALALAACAGGHVVEPTRPVDPNEAYVLLHIDYDRANFMPLELDVELTQVTWGRRQAPAPYSFQG